MELGGRPRPGKGCPFRDPPPPLEESRPGSVLVLFLGEGAGGLTLTIHHIAFKVVNQSQNSRDYSVSEMDSDI